MITLEQITECLDILDLKYTEVDERSVAVSFYEDSVFPYQVVNMLKVDEDGTIFHIISRATDYHPEGNLFELANRHNLRSYAPKCQVDVNDNQIEMHQAFFFDDEVSPHYVLENVVRPGVFLPIESFENLELSDEEFAERHKRRN